MLQEKSSRSAEQDLDLTMNELYRVLPLRLRAKATVIGVSMDKEYLFSYPQVAEVIRIATDNAISVLGVESFQAGLKVDRISAYEIPFEGNWKLFVELNNTQALDFVNNHSCRTERIYILTTASRTEFMSL